MTEPTIKQLRDRRRCSSDAYRRWNRERMREWRRERARLRTRCKNGHEYAVMGKTAGGQCRVCNTEASRKGGMVHCERSIARYTDLIARLEAGDPQVIDKYVKRIA